MDRLMFPSWLRPSIRVFDPAQRLFDEISRFFSERGLLIKKCAERNSNKTKIDKKPQIETRKRNCEYDEFDQLNNSKRIQKCDFKEKNEIEFDFLVNFIQLFYNFRIIIRILK